MLTYKCFHGLAPSYLCNLLQKYVPTLNLRSSNNPYLLKANRTKLIGSGDRAFATAAPKEWNALPLDIQSSETLDIFKKRLKTFLFKMCYIDI